MSASVRGGCRSVSHSTAVADCSLVLVKETRIDGHVLFHPLAYFDPEPLILEQAAQPVTVDQLGGSSTVPSRLRLGVTGERSGCDQQLFLSPTCHRAAEVS
jgi:hypothetical protein